jgi:hypothetical protein
MLFWAFSFSVSKLLMTYFILCLSSMLTPCGRRSFIELPIALGNKLPAFTGAWERENGSYAPAWEREKKWLRSLVGQESLPADCLNALSAKDCRPTLAPVGIPTPERGNEREKTRETIEKLPSVS